MLQIADEMLFWLSSLSDQCSVNTGLVDCNHTDMSSGEKFTIINYSIKALAIRNNKLSVRCSLVINDTTGKTALTESDRFAQHEAFGKDSLHTFNAAYIQALRDRGRILPCKTDIPEQVW